jgi:hypothetical protein
MGGPLDERRPEPPARPGPKHGGGGLKMPDGEAPEIGRKRGFGDYFPRKMNFFRRFWNFSPFLKTAFEGLETNFSPFAFSGEKIQFEHICGAKSKGVRAGGNNFSEKGEKIPPPGSKRVE